MVGGEIIPEYARQAQKSQFFDCICDFRDWFSAIAVTAYAGASDRRRALLAGFQTHLAKPIEPDDLVAVILSLTFQPDSE